MDPSDPAYKGQAEYTRFLLAIYDPFVLGFMARAVWRCPTPPIVERYRRLVGARHLEIGPGTGYFLAASGVGAATELTILDPNPNVLAKTSARLRDLEPTAVEADVLKRLPVGTPFDSVAMNYVLHCLPGPLSRKATAIANIARVMTPDAVLFGGTVLGRTERHLPQARAMLWVANRQGGFDNATDSVAGIRSILDASFEEVEVDVFGSIAHFIARKPTTTN